MKLRITTAAAAVASIFALSAAATGAGTGGSTSAGGSGVLGAASHTGTTTSVYAVDEAEFARLDANGDNRLNKTELSSMTALQQNWSAIDRDGDGHLTRDELARYHASSSTGGSAGATESTAQSAAAATGAGSLPPLTEPSGSESTGSDRTMGLDRSSTAGGSSVTEPRTATASDPALLVIVIDEPQFVRLDKDGDGRLSRDEINAVGRMQQSWDAMDADRDGYVSRAEMNDYRAKLGSAGNPGVTTTPADSTAPGSAPGATTEERRQ